MAVKMCACIWRVTVYVLQKDIGLFLHVEFIPPQVVFVQLVFYDSHAQRPDLEVRDDSVKLRETREAEEDVHNVGGQLGASLPVFTKNSRQCTNRRLCRTSNHSIKQERKSSVKSRWVEFLTKSVTLKNASDYQTNGYRIIGLTDEWNRVKGPI